MILRADKIVKYYGKRAVVKGVSVEVKQGEIVGLLGPNGAGKTSLISIICGTVKPSSGTVTIGNFDIIKKMVLFMSLVLKMELLSLDLQLFVVILTLLHMGHLVQLHLGLAHQK